MRSRILNSKFTISLFLFLFALLPRLLDLGRFLTADEFLWVDRSRNFLAGLTNSAYQCTTVVEKWEFAKGLACTLRTGHPGVTTMWTGSFGLWLRWLIDGRPASLYDYVVAVSTNPLDATFIAPERLGTVLITSIWVVFVYWLARRLFGPHVALVGTVLIALNPFHIAHSRVIQHDALSTTFMTLSVLSAFVYWGERQGRGWLLLSGILAGFAFLSKLASLFLMPYIALVGLWFFGVNWWHDKKSFPISNFYILILDGLLWFIAAVLLVFIAWPAMWVIPFEALQTAFLIGFKYTTGGHAKGNFLLGEISQDPGALFYPVTWLYRTSPLVILGLVGALAMWLPKFRGWLNTPVPRPNFTSKASRYIPLMLLFILSYYVMLVIGAKKQERYFLPAYPWFDFIAATGLVFVVNYLLIALIKPYISRLSHNISWPILAGSGYTQATLLLLVIILMVNGLLVVTNFPYYFTYYNPLLGGIRSATKAITIGWGEGLDLAADYLNQKTDPNQTRVSSWYESTFAPYYEGRAISYSKEKGKALAGDYVVFYINQTQRRFPDDIMFDYFEDRFELEKTVTLHGVDYAWIYPSLGVDHYVDDQTYTGIASLLAWQWTDGNPSLIPGQPADFELYWEYLGKEPDERFFFRLVDQQGRVWAEGESQVVAADNPPFEQWRVGEIISEQGTVIPPVDMPPGQYQLRIGFYTKAPAVTAGELLFDLPPDEGFVTVGHAPQASFVPPTPVASISESLGDSLTLLGAIWPQEPLTTNTEVPLELYWQVEHSLSAASEFHLGLMDENGEAQQGWFNLTLAETFNPGETTWQPGDIIRTHWQLELLPDIPPGDYHFEVVSSNDIETILPFGELRIGE